MRGLALREGPPEPQQQAERFFRPEVSGGLRMKGRNQQRGAGAGETERAIMIRCMVVAFAAAGLSVSLIYSLA